MPELWIKCDNLNCDYHHDVHYGLSEMKSFINRPCPKCGMNLMERSDYVIFRNLYILSWPNEQIARALNFLLGLIGISSGKVKVTVYKGELEMKEAEEKESEFFLNLLNLNGKKW